MHLRARFLEEHGLARDALARLYARLSAERFELGERLFDAERDRLAQLGVGGRLHDQLQRAVPTQICENELFSSVRLDYPFPHTVLSHPWGRDAAACLVRALAGAGLERLFFLGGVGALLPTLDVEDLLVPTRFLARRSPPVEIRYPRLPGLLRRLGRRRGFSGQVVSGAVYDVDTVLEENDAFVGKLRRRRICGVEMEGYGVASAAAEHQIACVCVFYVTDLPRRGKGYLFDRTAAIAAYGRPVRGRHIGLEAFYDRAGGRSSAGSGVFDE